MRRKIVIVIFLNFWIWFILKQQTTDGWLTSTNIFDPRTLRFNIVLNRLLINQIKYLSSSWNSMPAVMREETSHMEVLCDIGLWFCGGYVDMWFCGCNVLLILSLGEGGRGRVWCCKLMDRNVSVRQKFLILFIFTFLRNITLTLAM